MWRFGLFSNDLGEFDCASRALAFEFSAGIKRPAGYDCIEIANGLRASLAQEWAVRSNACLHCAGSFPGARLERVCFQMRRVACLYRAVTLPECLGCICEPGYDICVA